MLDKLEKRFGAYAIPNLMKYLIGGYVLGYVLYLLTSSSESVDVVSLMTLEPYYIIHQYQLWRLITWVLVPQSTGIFFLLIMMLLYYQLGTALERTWGTFRFNVYIFGGMLCTILGAFIIYGVIYLATGGMEIVGIGSYFSMYYINLSIFLAFAATYPTMRVMLYFIIPVPMWLMGIIYVAIIGFTLLASNWYVRVAIIASLLNFIIFFFATRNLKHMDPREIHRRNEFKRGMAAGQRQRQQQSQQFQQQFQQNLHQQRQARSNGQQAGAITRHRCAVCGRTEVSDPQLEFRFCSKCNGNYEYCSDHLFTHKHVE